MARIGWEAAWSERATGSSGARAGVGLGKGGLAVEAITAGMRQAAIEPSRRTMDSAAAVSGEARPYEVAEAPGDGAVTVPAEWLEAMGVVAEDAVRAGIDHCLGPGDVLGPRLGIHLTTPVDGDEHEVGDLVGRADPVGHARMPSQPATVRYHAPTPTGAMPACPNCPRESNKASAP